MEPKIWDPIGQLATVLAGTALEFAPQDFMFMGTAAGEGDTVVYVYKHIRLRVHLAIDAIGHAYEYRLDEDLRPERWRVGEFLGLSEAMRDLSSAIRPS